MARVPIIHLDNVLIATVLEEVHDRDAMDLLEGLTQTLARTGAQGILLDLSVVETVDSFLGRLLADIAACARLLGAQTVIVGLQPAVAITLVELGLTLPGVHTALHVDQGLARLYGLIGAEGVRHHTRFRRRAAH